MQNFKNYLKESEVSEYHGSIKVPNNIKDFSELVELFPGYTPGCKLIGDFDCSSCEQLKSLNGGPSEVDGNFSCGFNNIKSLEGAPHKVTGEFRCGFCNLITSLKGAPKYVGKDFSCFNCEQLVSLEGAPEEVFGYFSCANCIALTSLQHSPKKVHNDFSCFNCEQLVSLEGAPLEVDGEVNASFCKSITSLKGIGKNYFTSIRGNLDLEKCDNIQSNILGILLIKKLKTIILSNEKLVKILKYHLTSNRDILECQEELISKGFHQYAKL